MVFDRKLEITETFLAKQQTAEGKLRRLFEFSMVDYRQIWQPEAALGRSEGPAGNDAN